MASQPPDLRLPRVPWVAVAAEVTTAACIACLGLFLPLLYWVTWPELLIGCHFAIVVTGTLALALMLVRRRPTALKPAIVLAAYTGVPSLNVVSQVFALFKSAADSPAVMLSIIIWSIGLLGQVAVIVSCLGRLAPAPPLAAPNPDMASVCQ